MENDTDIIEDITESDLLSLEESEVEAIVETKDGDEEEMEEGNEFTKAAAKARVAGEEEFEFEGEVYPTEIDLEIAKKILGMEEDVKKIKAMAKTLKVGDVTNFGAVVKVASDSITFKNKDTPETKIKLDQRKSGGDYVLKPLQLMKEDSEQTEEVVAEETEEVIETAEEVVAEETEDEVVAEEVTEETEDEVVAEEVAEEEATEEVVENEVVAEETEEIEEATEEVVAEEEAIEEVVAEEVTEDEVDTENIKKLIESEEGLSDEFKAKSALIFETEIHNKVSQVKEELQLKYDAQLEEKVQEVTEENAKQIDGYLTYAVEEWLGENKVAVESSLRTTIAENFMSSLKDLFVEHYVEVPESKVDLYSNLEEEANQLKGDLAESKEIIEQLVDRLENLTREKIISESAQGLAETQVVKLESMVESIEFEDADSFSKRVETLKEFYFNVDSSITEEKESEEEQGDSSYVTTETIVEETEVEEVPNAMKKYLNAITRLDRASVKTK